LFCNSFSATSLRSPHLTSPDFTSPHITFQDKREHKHAGCVGLALLCDRLPVSWQRTHQATLIRALMFTFRDAVSEFAAETTAIANKTLDEVIDNCCAQVPVSKQSM
jgi:hypothetical protein